MNRPRRTKCFKTRGKKSEPHPNPLDPPRCRANKRKGRGHLCQRPSPHCRHCRSGKWSSQTVGGTSDQQKRRFCLMCISSPNYLPPCIPMSGAVIRVSTGVMPRFATGNANGHEMPMQMGFEKSTPTRLKAFGQRFAISCVRFVAFTRSFSPVMLQCVSFASILNALPVSLSHNSSLALTLNMSLS